MKNILQFKQLRDAYARGYEPENSRQLAEIYWGIVVSIAGAITVMTIGYGTWQLLAPLPDVISEGNSAAEIVGFSRAQLKTVVEVFEKQQTDFEALITQQ